MPLPTFSPKRRKFIRFVTNIIPIRKYRRALREIILLGGIRKYIKILKSDSKRHFTHTLTVTAIMKNEGAYIKEWLDYHILVGIEKFNWYDRNEVYDDIMDKYIIKLKNASK